MLTQLRRDLRKTVPYVLAAALILATLWIRQVLIALHDDKPAFIIFTAPVFLAAYIGAWARAWSPPFSARCAQTTMCLRQRAV
jgi:hypothetical protein